MYKNIFVLHIKYKKNKLVGYSETYLRLVLSFGVKKLVQISRRSLVEFNTVTYLMMNWRYNRTTQKTKTNTLYPLGTIKASQVVVLNEDM